MDKTLNTLNTILQNHRRERDAALKRPSIMRQRSARLTELLSSNLAKVITGPRRAGKSTLAFQVLASRKFAYVNFEDDALCGGFSSDDLMEAVSAVYGKTDFLFFDEIQNYPRWESFINKLQRRGCNLVLTGSNSKMLSRELGSALTGRHLAFELFPFSFSEFMIAQKLGKAGGGKKHFLHTSDAFGQYLVWGGFPEVVLEHAEPAGYLSHLFDSVVLRDIVTRHRVRQPTAIHGLLTLLVNSAANCFSARGLERSLGNLTTATIQRYLDYCREAYLVQDLQPYSFKARVRIKADRKIYAFDNGFITAKSQPATSNTSRLLENLVFIDLVRRSFKPNFDLFYYKTHSGFEVDFLLRRGSKNLELIQVAQNLAALKTKERETRALFQAAAELRLKKLTIVTLDTEQRIKANEGEINVVPCSTWLLDRVRGREGSDLSF
ncbi:MAG: hypothetical protein A3G87_04155 [Omnitrophica bacterium RIFCSPLOWO2_12_FULL_50_11]|nr:MAG: hypothetical protein A3G87_04155 [Omnitrophica bacterium RIFCSPLOWO2_12_FULL_50_11]